MRRTVFADKTRPVNRKTHGQFLQSDVMQHLIIRPLQKAGIQSDKRLYPFTGQPRGKRNGMLFGNTDIKKAVRILFGKRV